MVTDWKRSNLAFPLGKVARLAVTDEVIPTQRTFQNKQYNQNLTVNG